MKTLFVATVGLLTLTTSSAFAVVLEDFQGSYGGPGTLVTDPADASNTALHLVSNRGVLGTDADIFAIDTNGFVGKITMDIYDFGATVWDGPALPPFPANAGNDHGPRWGIQGDSNLDGDLDNWVAAGIMQKQFSNGTNFDANQGYAYVHDNAADDGNRAFSFNGDWFTPNFFGNPRRVKTATTGSVPGPAPGDGLQLIDTDGGGTPEVPLTPGTGAWTTWEFDISASGEVSITAKAGASGTKYGDSPYDDDVKTTYNPFGPPGEGNMTVVNMKQIWVTGGQSDVESIPKLGSMLGTQGILVDNVTFDGATSFSVADFDTDTDVDDQDLAIWAAAYGTGAGGDTDGDTDTDGADFLTWQQEFNWTCCAGGCRQCARAVVGVVADFRSPRDDGSGFQKARLISTVGVNQRR